MAALEKNLSIIDEVRNAAQVSVPWCDEFEKMISGMSFKSGNSDLMIQHKVSMMRTLRCFNNDSIEEDSTIDSLRNQRMKIAMKMLGRLGQATNIVQPFFIIWGCNTFIGSNVYINRDVSVHDDAPVFIGDRTLVGPSVCICTGTHDVDPSIRQEQGGSFARAIRIGDDCWIGARAVILPGVTIGDGSIVAAGAVVSKDVASNCVVGGVPARVIRHLDSGKVTRGLPGPDAILLS